MLGLEDIQKLEQRGKTRPLLRILTSVTEAPQTRIAAAEALGRLGDDKAVADLGVVAREASEWPVAAAALAALTTLGTEAAVHAIVDATPFVQRKRDQRAAVLSALVAILGVRRAQLGQLTGWLANPQSWDTFSVVVDALGEIGGSQAIGLLQSCLYDGEGRVRTRVAFALDALGWPERPADAPLAYFVALERWHDCLGFGPAGVEIMLDRARRGREAIVAALGAHASARAIAGLVRLAGQLATDLSEEDPRHRRGIARRLDMVTGALRGHDQETISGLVELLGASDSAAARAWALTTSTWFGAATFEAARAWLESPEATPHIRALAARALGRLGQADAVGPLMRAWRNDETNDVRLAASAALAELGPPTVAVLSRALLAPNVPRRPSLIYLLQQMEGPEALEVLCAEYDRTTDAAAAERLARVIEDKRAAAAPAELPTSRG